MLYITGDTHGNFTELERRLEGRSLTEDDVLLITGDFGFDWDKATMLRYQMFPHRPVIVFCDGNHENFDILETLPQTEMFGNVVGDFGNRTYRLLTGRMYDLEGFKTFVFGGAASIDRAYRIPWVSWWPDEIPKKAQIDLGLKTLEENGWKFDLFVSHTCPYPVKKTLQMDLLGFYDPTEKMLEGIVESIRVNGGSWGSSWFGHFHTDQDLPGNCHCRKKMVSRILGSTEFEDVLKRRRSVRKPEKKEKK